jgi:hypothetical protein
MAKEQIAQCIKVREVSVGDDEVKEVYTFSLEGKEFEVWERDGFQAKQGDKYRPYVVVVDSPYISKKNSKPYNRRVAAVNWEKA